MLPPPVATLNVTGIPGTPSPSAAVTFTTSGCARVATVGLPTTAVWPLPETAASAVGIGRTSSVTVSA